MEPFPRDNVHQLGRLSHRHLAMVNWLLLNPDKNLSQCAEELGYTPSYVRSVVNTDMFQAMYRDRQGQIAGAVDRTALAQLRGTATLVVEKLEARLSQTHSEKFLVDASKTVFGALGYGVPQAAASQHVHQHLHLTAADLAKAREAAAAHFGGMGGVAAAGVDGHPEGEGSIASIASIEKEEIVAA